MKIPGINRTGLSDKSPVSLTGRYTGQVWVENALSPEPFSTASGQWMYRTLHPLNLLSQRWLGLDLETLLLQRHLLLDRMLLQICRDHPGLQVLEIGCGLSSRAMRLLAHHQDTPSRYWEADLPDVISHKQGLLRSLDFCDARHRLVPCNILREQGQLSPEFLLDGFDPGLPLLILNEGLVNYFATPVMLGYWQRLQRALEGFSQGFYLAEIWPRLPAYNGLGMRQWAIRGIEAVTRQRVPLHFEDDAQMRSAFEALGFASVLVVNPDDVAQSCRLPTTAKPSLFRVVLAQTGAGGYDHWPPNR